MPIPRCGAEIYILFLSLPPPTPPKMETPLAHHISSAMYEIPKQVLIAFIMSVPFDFILIPQQYATDRPEDFFPFVDAVTHSLNKVLREKAPTKTSPKRTLLSSTIREDPLTPTPTFVTPRLSTIAHRTFRRDSADAQVNIIRPSRTPRTATPPLPPWNLSEDDNFLATNVTPIQDLPAPPTLSPTARRTILKQMTLAGSCLHQNRGLTQAKEYGKLSTDREPPRADITGYEPKRMSDERKRQMRPFMEEARKDLGKNPFMTVNLGQFPSLYVPQIHITGCLEPYEDDLGHKPVEFKEFMTLTVGQL